jgi:Arc/MetJ-type ribon-helix-helix transcriptional regulator
MEEASEQTLINVRLPAALGRRLDAELLSRTERGLLLTKSDLVREALDQMLPLEGGQRRVS